MVFYVGFVLFLLAQFIAVFTTDAPFVPVPRGVEDKIVESLKLDKDSMLYDLGCGDGRILFKAVKKYPEIRAVGMEIALFPYLLAKFKTRKYKNIEIKRENIFQTDLRPATHIFLYLYPKVLTKLLPQIKNDCNLGTKIISCDFIFENLKPSEIIELNNPQSQRGQKLFIYQI